MSAPKSFDLWTQTISSDVSLAHEKVDDIEALKLNSAGIGISAVSGTPVAGTRTSASIFTPSSGVFYDYVIFTALTDVTAANGYETFYPGETVTETTSSSTGVVVEATTTKLVLKTISAAFSGSKTLTGGTSGVTATGNASPVHVISNLKGQIVYSYVNGVVGTGTFCRIDSNTATAITVGINSLQTSADRIIRFADEDAARAALTLTYGS